MLSSVELVEALREFPAGVLAAGSEKLLLLQGSSRQQEASKCITISIVLVCFLHCCTPLFAVAKECGEVSPPIRSLY